MKSLFAFVPRLWANWITLSGAILTTCTGLAIVLAVVIESVSSGSNPYVNAVFVIALPILFMLGLILIPLGLWIDRRRKARGGAAAHNPVLDAFLSAMREQKAKRMVIFFAGATAANVLL